WLPAAITRERLRDRDGGSPRVVAGGLAAAAMSLVGVAAYSFYLWQRTGHPLAWVEGHAAWGRHYQGLSQLVVARYEFLANAGLYKYVAEQPYDLLNALGALFVVGAA